MAGASNVSNLSADKGTDSGNLSICGVGKKYGADWVLQGVDLAIPKGSFTCFVGPSGCGKTTLLRIIAGLLPLDKGTVAWLGTDITQQPAEKRNIGMVFQSAALFPHLTVSQNIAYGMKLRRKPQVEIDKRVEELLNVVKLSGLGNRGVNNLSGGQRQRVAIARALATEPELFLLDEPFSALDVPLREALQVEIAALQKRLNITTILVTHDRQEALSLADYLVVMNRGQIQQAGAPMDLYQNPANSFVAKFLGGANLLPATVCEGGVICGGQRWEVGIDSLKHFSEGQKITLACSPDQTSWSHQQQAGRNCFQAEIVFIRSNGNLHQAHLKFGDCQLRVSLDKHTSNGPMPLIGRSGWFSISPEQIWLYPENPTI
jgi:putative spermidine/putrescine transport system ATP-binding protein